MSALVATSLATTILAATIAVAAGCSDSTRPEDVFATPDATPEAALPDSNVVDSGSDGKAPPRDAATSDAGPRPVECGAPPCATALVTTLAGEGFCVLLQDKTVACWGQNSGGELGRGPAAGADDSATPARVLDLTNVVELDHSCALDASGAIWCWGTGPYLRDAYSPTTLEQSPVKLDIPAATKFGVGAQTACAVVDGGVLCWGSNANGEVAPPVVGADPFQGLPATPVTLPPGAPIRRLSVGNAAFVLREDGTVVSWGANPPVARVTSLSPDPYPDVVPLSGVSGIEIAEDNACAVVSGIAHCWGNPIYFGSYPAIIPLRDRKYPEPVTTNEPVVQIGTSFTFPADDWAGAPAIPQRACAVGVSGAVYCWGSNGSGQAGDGTTKYASLATKVTLPAPAASVKTTPKASCALLVTGKVMCWGDRFRGQLGDGRITTPSLVPREVLLP